VHRLRLDDKTVCHRKMQVRHKAQHIENVLSTCQIVYDKSQWIADRLTPLRVTQVDRVSGPARPTISAKKMPFLLPCVRGHVASTANALYNWIKNCSSQSLWGAWNVGAEPPPPPPPLGPESDSKVKTDESKGFPASCGLGTRRTWYTSHGKVFGNALSYSKE
jgi:hypothetical protein